jgi:UDP-glucose 4-epimerase
MRPSIDTYAPTGTREDTVLITGGAGFVGSHLSERLLSAGRQVVVLDDFSTGDRANLDGIADHSRLSIVEGSVADEVVVSKLAADAETIVHLAAAVGVNLIIDQPLRTIETNVRGTENVLAAALNSGSRVLVASTSEVYGKGVRFPLAEDDDVVLGPTSKRRWAYAASKMIDEFLCFAYHAEHGISATPVRLFNTVGARQTGRYGMVIPRLVGQALDGEPISVFGDGTQRRCFCDVRDVVDALEGLISQVDAPVRVYNIGNTEEVTIDELATRIKTATGSTSPIVHVPYDEAYPPGFEDMQRRIPDTTRIRAQVGWVPKHSLDDILSSVIQHELARRAVRR